MITTSTITKYTVLPSETYIYYVFQGSNGNVYQYGIADGPLSFATDQNGGAFDAETFYDWLQLFATNSIGLVELGHLKMRMSGDATSDYVNSEIFSLTTEQITWIISNFDPVELVEKLGLFSLAQVFLIGGVFGNLQTTEGATAALSIMANISAYWIQHKGSTRAGIIEDAQVLKAYLETNLSYSTEDTDSLLSLFIATLDARLA